MVLSQVEELDTSMYAERKKPDKEPDKRPVDEAEHKGKRKDRKENTAPEPVKDRNMPKGMTMSVRRDTVKRIRAVKLAVNLSSNKSFTTSKLLDSLLDKYIESFDDNTLNAYNTILKMMSQNNI